MDKLLHFLNTADVNSLTRIPGVTTPLAEGLIAGRPFNSVDECLQVKGMGKNILARIQTVVDANEPEPEEIALIPAEEEPILIEASQPAKETESDDKPSFGSRLGNALLTFLRALLRLILVILLIGGVGAAIYFGYPLLRERFIAPVEQNTARVTELENEVADLKIQLSEINQRVDEMNASIEAHTATLEKLESMQHTLETQLQCFS